MGSGFRTFQSGEVLTAANVQDYLMDQSVQVYAGTAALGSAIGTAVETGMVAYVQDTDQILHYRADTAHGTSWAAMPMRGGSLNAIINGGFDVWQRGTSFTLGSNSASYTADRWFAYSPTGAAMTVSRQAFTLGSAPYQGYEAPFFIRHTIGTAAAGQFWSNEQRIESVRTFANQTITVSFWAKADASRTIGLLYNQNFGTGGSPSATVSGDVGPGSNSISLTTTFQRFSYTVAVPSIAGKTIGTNGNDFFLLSFYGSTAATATIDIWGVQAELGSAATPFETEMLGVTLAKCQRYYWRSNPDGSTYGRFGNGRASSATNVQAQFVNPVEMRTKAASVEFSTLAVDGPNFASITAISMSEASRLISSVAITSSGMTTNGFYEINGNNSSAAYIAFSAEL